MVRAAGVPSQSNPSTPPPPPTRPLGPQKCRIAKTAAGFSMGGGGVIRPTTTAGAGPLSLQGRGWKGISHYGGYVPKSFLKVGCLWPNDDGSHIALGGLPKTKYGPDSDFIDFAPRPVRPEVSPQPSA